MEKRRDKERLSHGAQSDRRVLTPSIFARALRRLSIRQGRARLLAVVLLSITLVNGGCFESETGEQFYGKVLVPSTQEFRWSDGGLPRVFDPARAAAPPDTDVVRALFEGLTEYDPKTLKPLPAVAREWESAEDGTEWTFRLRDDARWSNGDRVTAEDFVRSWQRTLLLGERAPHSTLLQNIRGAKDLTRIINAEPMPTTATSENVESSQQEGDSAPREAFGAEAVDASTLRVRLRRPDRNFPSLVAHTVFRPIHELTPTVDLSQLRDEGDKQASEPEIHAITNGAFTLSGLADNSIVLERASHYWGASSISLERVRFVEARSTEAALAAYKAGEIDALTNAPFEPLAVKILTPYKDFRREVFGALLYYQFNLNKPPFNDRRVREAFAMAIDVAQISSETLGGATQPAKTFLPEPADREATPTNEPTPQSRKDSARAQEAKNDAEGAVVHDVEGAKHLLAEAGYPGGAGFPIVRLLVNRNEQQRLVAQAAVRMWREALGVEVEIVIRDWEVYESMLKSGEFDIVRRSIVLQTTDEETNMIAMFGESSQAPHDKSQATTSSETNFLDTQDGNTETKDRPQILSESQALKELPAVPIYFASSYALVKPYVNGFNSNLLDAPSLKHVKLETRWKPPARRTTSLLIGGLHR